MKKYLIAILCVFLMVGFAYARQVELGVGVQYTAPYPQYEPSGWKLYMDGGATAVCEQQTITDGVMNCPPFEAVAGDHTWNASVLYQNGDESPRSPDFPFFIEPSDLPGPIIFEMNMFLNGQPVTMRGTIVPQLLSLK